MSCDVEQSYSCRGFFDGDCKGCDPDEGKGCSSGQKEDCPVCGKYSVRGEESDRGCYSDILKQYQKYYFPIGITAAVVEVFVLLNIGLVWIIKEKEWYLEY